MNTRVLIFTLLFFSTATIAWAESSVNIDVKNKVNATNNGKVTNHIEVEINGEKRVIDDTQEGSSVDSTIKVEAKSEEGQTTFNIEGNPQSVKSETTTESDSTLTTQPVAQAHPPVEEKQEDKSLITKIVDFFKSVIDFFIK